MTQFHFRFKEINDKDKWEQLIKNFDEASLLNSWAWGEYQEYLGKTVQRFGIFNDDELIGAIPLTIEYAKRAKYIRIEHAPLVDWQNQSFVKELAQFLRNLGKRHKVWYVRINPRLPNTPQNSNILRNVGFIKSPIYYANAACTQIIDLTNSLDDIFKQFRKSTRERIRQAQRRGLEVEISDQDDAFRVFEDLYKETVNRNKWHAENLSKLKKEYEIFKKNNMIKLFLVKYKPDNIYVAASFTVIYNREIISLHSGTSTRYRKLPLAYLIRWEHIRYAKELGLARYNFWGIAPPNASSKHPWARLSEFKRGFGGQFVQYIGSWDLPINKLLTTVIHLYEQLRDKMRGY